MIKFIVPLLLGCFAVSTFVHSASFKDGYGACLSEDQLDQLTNALIKKDQRSFDYLLNNGCIVTKADIPITVLDRTWSGTVKVRAYFGNQSIEMWTVMENVENN